MSVVTELSGTVSVRFQGVEFARLEKGRLFLGLTDPQPVSASELDSVKAFAFQLHALQNAPSLPERWLEGIVRANVLTVDPQLLPAPIHGQVLTFSGRDRESIDLLAISPGGRLSVLELKASEDLHLPTQALDYWMRIKWHSERGELQHLFPGIAVSTQTPKLVLLAPALSFHSANVAVLRYFSPEVDIERIGINSDWRTQFRVVMRLAGAEVPISHGRSEWPYKV